MVTGTDYQTYFNGAQFVHFLLGWRRSRSACLSTPIWRSSGRNFWPMAASLAA